MTASPASTTAIVSLSTFEDSEADAAFARLAEQGSSAGRVVRARHPAHPDGGPLGYLTVSDAEIGAVLPSRLAELRNLNGAIARGYVDLVQIALMALLAEFDPIWFIEYDVEYSGHWGDFFSSFDSCVADLLGAALAARADSKSWRHWANFQPASSADPAKVWKGFFPVVRFSQRFRMAYTDGVTEWGGSYEALYPTVALHQGLQVEEIGGWGTLTPPDRRGQYYATGEERPLSESTYRAWPEVASFYMRPGHEWLPTNSLWHPVKTKAWQQSHWNKRKQASTAAH